MYRAKLDEIERHLANAEYESCVGDCGRLFELAMRTLLQDLIQNSRKASDRTQIGKGEFRI